MISSTRGLSDKFNLEVEETIQNEEDQKELEVNESSVTYLDALWQHLYPNKHF